MNKRRIKSLMLINLLALILAFGGCSQKTDDKENPADSTDVISAETEENTEAAEIETTEEVKPETLEQELLKRRGIDFDNSDYVKFAGGEILTENTRFSGYAFAEGNKIYSFNPELLMAGSISYAELYTLPEEFNNIKIVYMSNGTCADINFVTEDDRYYWLKDDNMHLKDVTEGFPPYENSVYSLELNDEPYSVFTYEQKVDGSCYTPQLVVTDNTLKFFYPSYWHYTENRMVESRFADVSGPHTGENIITVYSNNFLKTDKGYYLIRKYYADEPDESGSTERVTTLRINLMTKYYDEILTISYQYIILKDYTVIPIKDIITDYVSSDYTGGYNTPPEKLEID